MAAAAPAPAPGRTLWDPRGRGSVTFAVTGTDSGGHLLSTVSVLRPGFPRPPLHVHPHQSERFAVRRGRLEVVHGGRAVLLGPGDALEVAPGVPHTFAVAEEEVEVQVDFAPAGEMEGFLVGLWRLAGALPSLRGVRGLAALALAHPAEFRLARLPTRAQRALFAALAPRQGCGKPHGGLRDHPRADAGHPPRRPRAAVAGCNA